MLDLVRQAERFIATPSESRLGNAQIARAACELLGSLGIPARIESARVHGVTHHAVIADLGPREAGEGLLLLTHLDTVPPGAPDDWTATGGDPFRPTRDGDRLYGLGSADAKVDLICKAAALEGLDPGRLRRPLRIVGTFAEEIGLLGARWLVDAGGTAGMRRALVGEPSDLTAIYAHKGYAKFEALVHCPPVARAASAVSREATLRGRSAHSSTPHLGENAIEAALERLVQSDPVGLIELTAGSAVNKVPDSCHVRWLAAGASAPAAGADALDPKPVLAFFDAWRRWRGSLESWRDDLFDPPHVICNLGCAERVPDGLLFQFDLRPVPGVDAQQLVRPLEAVAELRCLRTNPALQGRPDETLVEAIVAGQKACGLGRRVATKATCTEAGLLSTAGLEAVVFGAGISVGNVHRPNEHTLVSQLALARDVYRHTVQRLCIDADSEVTRL